VWLNERVNRTACKIKQMDVTEREERTADIGPNGYRRIKREGAFNALTIQKYTFSSC